MFVKSGSITLERLLVSVMSDLSLEFGKRLSLSYLGKWRKRTFRNSSPEKYRSLEDMIAPTELE